MKRVTKQHFFAGFSIIELLVVMSVIVTLAAIVLVSYTAVQKRGYDAMVQSDLTANMKIIAAHFADTSMYPTESGLGGLAAKMTFARANYDTSASAALYCRTADGVAAIAGIVAKSKSGKVWYITSNNKIVREASFAFPGAMSTMCSNIGITDPSNGTAGNWLHDIGQSANGNGGWDTWIK